ncbi:MAG: carboxyl transferase [Lachnospiraceae bacterium]|nr:carboxyl transferase [Lachnospiraceae bacterium]
MSTNLAASGRIKQLLDDNSFVEIGSLVTARATDFNMMPAELPSDGCVTGYGTINDNLVYVYSQDASVLGGTIGEMHARKIVNIYNLALKMGAPVIGIIDCAGLRLQEATDALNAFGEVYAKQVAASGVIPQITAIVGKCGGGLALFPTLTDFTFMLRDNAKLFVNSPNALDGNTEQKNNTASAAFQAVEAGLVDVVDEEEDLYQAIRSLVDFLPANNYDVNDIECTDDLNRTFDNLEGFAGDTAELLKVIADDNDFFEIKSSFASEMVTGFIRLDGVTVGAVANRSEILPDGDMEGEKFGTVLTTAGCYKAEEFVKFCDAFDIPVLSLTNVTGYEATVASEKTIARAAAKLTAAFAGATVPKVNVIVGKAYGTAANVMNSKAIGCDITIAWPGSKIGTMDSKLAAKIMYEGQGSDVIDAKAKEYEELTLAAASAARRGYVDQIIEPADTRKYVIGAFEMLLSKEEIPYDKKHLTI